MNVKAILRVVLLANDVTVAESDDETLWQQTLAAVTGQTATTPRLSDDPVGLDARDAPRPYGHRGFKTEVSPQSDSLQDLANELTLDLATVQGACDPSTEAPYIHLDVRAWQEFKRNLPKRGTTSIPPIVLAATLLVIWSKKIGLSSVTISQAQSVLNTIDIRDQNPARGLRNCDWLQTRDENIKLNPSRYDQAIALVKAFCSRQPIET